MMSASQAERKMTTKDAAPPDTSKLLIFVKSKRPLAATVGYLKQQNFTVGVTDNFKDPIILTKAFNPGVVLLSWSFGAREVKRIYDRFSQERPDLLVLVFAESTSPREMASLTRSGITTTVFPPLNGRGIQLRIENYLRKRARKELLNQAKKATVADIPADKDLEWREVPPEEGATTKIWMSEAKKPNSTESYVFYVEGNQAPMFNAATKSWEGFDVKSLVAREKENGFEAETEVPLMNYRKPGQSQAGEIESSVRKAAADIFKPGDHTASSKVTNLATVGAIMVNTPKYKGYMLMANADQSFRPQMLEDFGKKFFSEMGLNLNPGNAVKVELEPISYNSWSDRLEFLAVFQHEGQDVAILFIPSDNLPASNAEDVNLLNVSPSDNLFPGSKIDFDLFLHMPKNSKYLLYLKRGSEVSGTVLDKLAKFNVQKMAIPRTDLERFIAYLVNGLLTVDDDEPLGIAQKT